MPAPALTAAMLLNSLNSGTPAYDPNYAKDLGMPDDVVNLDPSLLDLNNLCGITVTSDPQTGGGTTVNVHELDRLTVPSWLQEARDLRAANRPHFRLLWGEQIYRNDSLRAWQAGNSVALSKRELTECLDLQPMAIEKMGTDTPWIMRLPQRLSALKSTSYFGLSANLMSITWSYDTTGQATSALVVGRGSSSRSIRDSLVGYIESLKHLYYLPAYLPLVIASVEVAVVSQSLARRERVAAQTFRELTKLLYHQDPLMAFLESSDEMRVLSQTLPHLEMVLEMAQDDEMRLARGRLASTSDDDDSSLLVQALDLRAQELVSLRRGVEGLKEQTTNHLAGIMSLMSFHQHRTGQETAEARRKDSKAMMDIVKATRTDIASMKVLALIAIIFLPSTAILTIMAIPNVFDSSGPGLGGPLVSSRLGVFLAVSIPMALLTIAITWLWLRRETLGRPLFWKLIARPRAHADAKTLV